MCVFPTEYSLSERSDSSSFGAWDGSNSEDCFGFHLHRWSGWMVDAMMSLGLISSTQMLAILDRTLRSNGRDVTQIVPLQTHSLVH